MKKINVQSFMRHHITLNRDLSYSEPEHPEVYSILCVRIWQRFLNWFPPEYLDILESL